MNEALLFAVLLAAAPPAAAPVPDSSALTMREAVSRALLHAPEVAIARAGADEANAAWRAIGSEKNPQFSVNTTPGWSTGVPLSVAGEVPSAVGARIRLMLYDPVVRGEELQARARAAASEGALADARNESARRTAAVCAKLFADDARVEAAKRRLAAQESIVRQERALAREGRRTELEVGRAELEEARARQKQYAAESDRDLDRHELAQLVGLPAGSPVTLREDPEQIVPEPQPVDAVALALGRDQQLKSLGEEAEALSQSAKFLTRVFKPSINAEARYAYVPAAFGYEKYYLNFQENVASIGVSVVLPVLTGGRESAQAAQSRARVEQAEAQRTLRESDLTRQVREAEARSARAALDAGLARRSVALSAEALAQAQALRREGRGDADGVERAELALSDSEDELARARREQVDARLHLLSLEGELLPALGVADGTGISQP